jgi:formylglycine-generating enzyme required for sulfatase activity
MRAWLVIVPVFVLALPAAAARRPPGPAPPADVLLRGAPDGAVVRLPGVSPEDCEVRRPLPERVLLVVKGVTLVSREIVERAEWVRSVHVLGPDMTGLDESHIVMALSTSAFSTRLAPSGDGAVLVIEGVTGNDAPASEPAEDTRKAEREERRRENEERAAAEMQAREDDRAARRLDRPDRDALRAERETERTERRTSRGAVAEADAQAPAAEPAAPARTRPVEPVEPAAPSSPGAGADRGPASRTIAPDTSPDDGMVRVPAGPFVMGTLNGEGFADESPRHVVELPDFWIDAHEVTVEDFRRSPLRLPEQPAWSRDGRVPVLDVSWHDAGEYCEWAGKRLPTEAEWEKAARGSEGRLYPWGSGWSVGRTNSGVDGDGFEFAAPVGSFPEGASVNGALDMSGNAWEWVADWYARQAYEDSPVASPTGPSRGTHRVARGGSFRGAYSVNVRAAVRLPLPPSARRDDVGFRCAR